MSLPLKKTILIVDDERLIILTLKTILEGQGFAVKSAVSGEEALAEMRKQEIPGHGHHLPDLVLLDVIMPGMNGLEVVREMKEDEKLKDIPVFMLTGHLAHDSHEAKLGGALEVITKPVVTEKLLATIRHHLKMPAATVSSHAHHPSRYHRH